MSSLTWRISAESLVFPGQHHTRSGIPSRVTAIPMTIWGRSSRWSLDLPRVRNPASRPSPSPVPSGTGLPCWSRATGASASSVTKYVEVVSKNSRSTSGPRTSDARSKTCFSSCSRICSSQSIAR